MKDRIRKLMEDKNMTQLDFANFLNISPASLSSIFSGRTAPTLNIVNAIKNKMPDVNTDWLLFGNGSMTSEVREPDLFADSPSSTPLEDFVVENKEGSTVSSSSRQEIPSQTPTNIIVKNLDKPERKISEIRVFYDDQTFESFVPS